MTELDMLSYMFVIFGVGVLLSYGITTLWIYLNGRREKKKDVDSHLAELLEEFW